MSDPRQPGGPIPGPDKPALPKRFYAAAGVEQRDGAFALVLDGRPARSPGKRPLALPNRALAEAVAAEWAAQVDVIDPATMPMTRIANSAIDGVAETMPDVRDDLARYAASDLVCYRAGEPDKLVALQAEAWDPVLAWVREAHGAQFVMSVGVVFVQQPEPALARMRAALEAETSPFVLAGLHVMTTLTGSVLIALMQAAGALDPAAAWRAAHVDEVHQESQWGQDYEAAQRRDRREAEFQAAARFVALVRGA